MQWIKIPTTLRTMLAVSIVLAFSVIGGTAWAACQPGQLQEANLAYTSAVEFLNTGKWDQAIARMKSIVDVCPEHVEATRGIAQGYEGKEDFANAEIWYAMVIELRGDEAEAGDFGNLAKVYTKLKKYKEARAEYMKAQLIAPDDCGVLFNLGVLHSASGYHAQAVEVFEHALEVCPTARDQILVQLSKAAGKASEQQKKAGNNAKAAEYAELMNKYGGQAGGSTTYDMVKQKMTEKKYNEAIPLLQQMLAKDPNQPNALLTLARAQDAAQQKSASVESYRKYLAMNPNDATETGNMLQVMVEAGQSDRAAVEAQMAAQRLESQGRSQTAGVYYSWGLALEAQGQYAQARAKFAVAAASGNSRFAKSAQTQVERMDGFIAREEAEKKRAKQGN